MRALNTKGGTEFFGGRARLIDFPVQAEPRGCLVPFDFARLPFSPRHAFIIRDVPAGQTRGLHALKNAQQLLVCLAGQVDVELREAGRSETVALGRPALGLFIAEKLWAAQTYRTPEAVLLVLASRPYDPENYLAEP